MKKFSSLLIVLLLMFASFTAGLEYPRGDMDQDGKVTIGDVTCLVDYLLNGTWEDEPVTPDEHEWVDLGLPSGVEWATCNIGATKPEEYGYYFAWGEIEPKDVYDWSTYKWCTGSEAEMTKYVSGQCELYLADDAAAANWGDPWQMPPVEYVWELIEECEWNWTTLNGVDGYMLTGPNGNTMFLPAAGCRVNGTIERVGEYCDFWSSTHSNHMSAYAYSMASYDPIDEGSIGCKRFWGLPVRAVRLY